jgi:uncharacterized protein (DUF488 family)
MNFTYKITMAGYYWDMAMHGLDRAIELKSDTEDMTYLLNCKKNLLNAPSNGKYLATALTEWYKAISVVRDRKAVQEVSSGSRQNIYRTVHAYKTSRTYPDIDTQPRSL